eukprot:SAG22_NODE_67_length_22882_cov_25.671553_19_plen_272_part_00
MRASNTDAARLLPVAATETSTAGGGGPSGAGAGRRSAQWQDIVPVAIVVVLFIVGFVLLLIPQTREDLVQAMDWAKDKPSTAVLFSLVFVVSILVGLPSVVFVVMAGIVWGGLLGFVSVWFGGIVGAAIVFKIGRTWLTASLEILCWSKSATLKEIKKLMSDPEHGWKWALLIRLPYMPYPQMSYALSATDMDFKTYMWTSAVGSIPGVFAYIYLGAGIKNLRDYMTHGTGGSTTVILQLCAAGFCIVAFTALACVAKKRVNAKARMSQTC